MLRGCGWGTGLGDVADKRLRRKEGVLLTSQTDWTFINWTFNNRSAPCLLHTEDIVYITAEGGRSNDWVFDYVWRWRASLSFEESVWPWRGQCMYVCEGHAPYKQRVARWCVGCLHLQNTQWPFFMTTQFCSVGVRENFDKMVSRHYRCQYQKVNLDVAHCLNLAQFDRV